MKKTAMAGASILPITTGSHEREVVFYEPRILSDVPTFVITADSVCLEPGNGTIDDRRYTKMGDVNRINHAADRYGFIAVHLLYKKRMLGLISGPNAPGTFLPFDERYNDVDYLKAVVDHIDKHWGSSSRKISIGFSSGAQFLLRALKEMPRVFSAFVSVSGTTLGTERPVPAGVSLISFHGMSDPRLPYNGGLPKGGLINLVMGSLVSPYAESSNPSQLPRLFLEANGFEFRVIQADTKVGTRRTYTRDESAVKIIEYIANDPWGGCTYHGREDVPSLLSKGHGGPAPRMLYSINDLFCRELGMRTVA
jgi:poly(3-hydroxybutyrate) depolymerase